MNISRSRFPAFALLVVALALPAPGCHPSPVPDDGGHVTPSGVLAVIDTVATVLDVVLPFLRPLLQREVPDGAPKFAVMVSLTAFETAGNAWQAGHSTWAARGGDACASFALSGALTEAGRQLARDLGRAGIGWGPDLEALLTSLGRLGDRQAGACAVDGGALTASSRVGDAIRMDFELIEQRARTRGVSLRPLPAIERQR
ncbi:MAG: hypothetical protein Q8S73_37840 [Deltaproteobacteria bacterium]|nr:hypothetical protein [Myxococcales bacterium]MDP3219924.1 hypothetical protein [Deltaproteobacteria bacterium]